MTLPGDGASACGDLAVGAGFALDDAAVAAAVARGAQAPELAQLDRGLAVSRFDLEQRQDQAGRVERRRLKAILLSDNTVAALYLFTRTVAGFVQQEAWGELWTPDPDATLMSLPRNLFVHSAAVHRWARERGADEAELDRLHRDPLGAQVDGHRHPYFPRGDGARHFDPVTVNPREQPFRQPDQWYAARRIRDRPPPPPEDQDPGVPAHRHDLRPRRRRLDDAGAAVRADAPADPGQDDAPMDGAGRPWPVRWHLGLAHATDAAPRVLPPPGEWGHRRLPGEWSTDPAYTGWGLPTTRRLTGTLHLLNGGTARGLIGAFLPWDEKWPVPRRAPADGDPTPLAKRDADISDWEFFARYGELLSDRLLAAFRAVMTEVRVCRDARLRTCNLPSLLKTELVATKLAEWVALVLLRQRVLSSKQWARKEVIAALSHHLDSCRHFFDRPALGTNHLVVAGDDEREPPPDPAEDAPPPQPGAPPPPPPPQPPPPRLGALRQPFGRRRDNAAAWRFDDVVLRPGPPRAEPDAASHASWQPDGPAERPEASELGDPRHH